MFVFRVEGSSPTRATARSDESARVGPTRPTRRDRPRRVSRSSNASASASIAASSSRRRRRVARWPAKRRRRRTRRLAKPAPGAPPPEDANPGKVIACPPRSAPSSSATRRQSHPPRVSGRHDASAALSAMTPRPPIRPPRRRRRRVPLGTPRVETRDSNRRAAPDDREETSRRFRRWNARVRRDFGFARRCGAGSMPPPRDVGDVNQTLRAPRTIPVATRARVSTGFMSNVLARRE